MGLHVLESLGVELAKGWMSLHGPPLKVLLRAFSRVNFLLIPISSVILARHISSPYAIICLDTGADLRSEVMVCGQNYMKNSPFMIHVPSRKLRSDSCLVWNPHWIGRPIPAGAKLTITFHQDLQQERQ